MRGFLSVQRSDKPHLTKPKATQRQQFARIKQCRRYRICYRCTAWRRTFMRPEYGYCQSVFRTENARASRVVLAELGRAMIGRRSLANHHRGPDHLTAEGGVGRKKPARPFREMFKLYRGSFQKHCGRIVGGSAVWARGASRGEPGCRSEEATPAASVCLPLKK